MSISRACNSWPQCVPRPRGRQPLPTPTAGPQCAAQGVRRENGASHGHGLFGMRSGTHENPPERLTARGARAGEPMCRSAGLGHHRDGVRLVARKVVSRENQAPGDHAVCSLVSSAPRSLSGASHCASATSGRLFSALAHGVHRVQVGERRGCDAKTAHPTGTGSSGCDQARMRTPRSVSLRVLGGQELFSQDHGSGQLGGGGAGHGVGRFNGSHHGHRVSYRLLPFWCL